MFPQKMETIPFCVDFYVLLIVACLSIVSCCAGCFSSFWQHTGVIQASHGTQIDMAVASASPDIASSPSCVRKYVLVPFLGTFSKSKTCQNWQVVELPILASFEVASFGKLQEFPTSAKPRSCQHWLLLKVSTNGCF